MSSSQTGAKPEAVRSRPCRLRGALRPGAERPDFGDLFSLQGLRNPGPTLRRWRSEWKERLAKNPAPDLKLPPGQIQPIGYVVLRHSIRLDRPVQAFERWTLTPANAVIFYMSVVNMHVY